MADDVRRSAPLERSNRLAQPLPEQQQVVMRTLKPQHGIAEIDLCAAGGSSVVSPTHSTRPLLMPSALAHGWAGSMVRTVTFASSGRGHPISP
jgi:hypothetical protein